MAEIKHHKVVASLPSSLEADSVYYVRVGSGYDQYVTNNSGVVVAYESNVKIALEGKVDKESGKQLSDENYTLDEKNKLASLENFDDSVIQAELDTKVDKIAGKGLSTEDFTSTEKGKLAELENFDDSAIQAELSNKVDKVVGKQLSTEDYSTEEKNKLSGVEAGATKNATDAQLRSRATHTGVQPISSVTNLQSSLDSKVDKQAGYGLSQENYTPAEKSKLSSLEGSKFKGEYVSLAALEAAQPSPEVGSYAYVDIGVGEVVTKYIWDSSDAEWVNQQGEAASLTPAEVKSLYEGNPDTNAFTDSEKTKLSGIQASATANATDAQLRARSSHTGTQAISTIAGLDTALNGKVDTTDPRLSDPRTPTGTAGGVLSGAYPNPTFAVDMATQAELDAVAADKVDKVAGKGLSDENYTLAEKNKLVGVEAGAQVNSVTSVAGRTGAVVVSSADVGLGDADNTSDMAKPVSTAQQDALNLKLDADEWYLGTDKQHTADATGAVALDLATASTFDLTLTGNTTLTVSNAVVPAGETRSVVVRIRQGATARTLTWWAGITWLASTTPAAPEESKIKEYVLSYDGSSWLGREGASN